MPDDELTAGRWRFTDAVKEVLGNATVTARKMGHQVSPEHILLALLNHRRALGLAILQELGVNGNALAQRLRNMMVVDPQQRSTAGTLSDRAKRVAELMVQEAQTLTSPYVGTEHLLLGLLEEGRGDASYLLSQYGVTRYSVHRTLRTIRARDGDAVPVVRLKNHSQFGMGPLAGLEGVPIRPSPIFLAMLGVTVLAGALAFFRVLIPQINIFLFVAGAWMTSVCLHEFGHALVAYIGGDSSVVGKGYLTLNPLKYTHPILSIVLPLVFLVLGGIGLPGGAVYINRAAIRGRGMNSLVSAAGPIATALCGFVLLIPFFLGIPQADTLAHPEFWGGYAFLTFLEFTALFINLLPIPGLDGFGIIAPYLPDRIVYRLYGLGNLTFLLLFLLIAMPNPFSNLFWGAIWGVTGLFGVDAELVLVGRALFRFRAIP